MEILWLRFYVFFQRTELTVVNSGALGTNSSATFNDSIGHYVIFFAAVNAPKSVTGLTLIFSQQSTGSAYASVYEVTATSAQITSNGGGGYIELASDL